MKKEHRLIGVAWPYVNGDLHIGHLAGYLLPADIFARFSRATGHEVLMVSGSDCFGTPIVLEADKRSVTPQEVVDEYHAKNAHLLKDVLDLTYDMYTRTDHKNHIAVTQEVFLGMIKSGYITIDTQHQYYSEADKRFLPDRYVEGKCKNCGFEDARSDQCDNCGKVLDEGDLLDPRSKLSGEEVTIKETQHYFVDWPKLQPHIEEFVKKNGPKWKNWVYQETLGWLKQGLKPRAITRDLDWGVPIPVDRIPEDMQIDNAENKRIYVWFDAVIGYLSAAKLWATENNKQWEPFWKDSQDVNHYYFMGKDNLIFHTIFWPGQIMGHDKTLHLPDLPSINMFLNFEGKQFSKSRGISISISEMADKYNMDAVRFYLTLIMPEAKDSSFTWKDFYNKNNEILVGNLGNLFHRVLSIAKGVDLTGFYKAKVEDDVAKKITDTFSVARDNLNKCEFCSYLNSVLELSTFANRYLDNAKFWELKKSDEERFSKVLKQLYSVILALGYLISPLMPKSSVKLFEMMGLKCEDRWPEIGQEIDKIAKLAAKVDNLQKPEILFVKLEPTIES